MVGPRHAALFEVFAQGLDGAEELALLHGESANGEVDRRAFLKQQQDFQQGGGILAPGKRHRHAVAIANHFEAVYGLADLAQKGFLKIH